MTIPKELVCLTIIPPLIAIWLLLRWRSIGVNESPRYGYGLTMCLALNGCGCFFVYSGYAALLLAPILCFSIAVAVATTVGRYLFLVGVAGCPWFLLPAVMYTRYTYDSEQIAAYGMPPFDRFTGFVLACGVAGAMFTQIVIPLFEATNKPMHPSRGSGVS
jgi:hypothetical protein